MIQKLRSWNRSSEKLC